MGRCTSLIEKYKDTTVGKYPSFISGYIFKLEGALKNNIKYKNDIEVILNKDSSKDNFEQSELENMKVRIAYYDKLINLTDKYIKDVKKLAIKYKQD